MFLLVRALRHCSALCYLGVAFFVSETKFLGGKGASTLNRVLACFDPRDLI